MSDELPEAAQTLMKQAYDQLTEGRFEEAVETFSASIAMGSQEAQALRGRGLAYLQLKRWSLATADFTAARDLAPEDPNHWVELAISLARDDKAYEAIDVFEELLHQQPQCARAHLELGLLHIRLGAIPKGREQLQQALTCRPTLEQRRRIESMLHEQALLDRKRFYRPDFEALHRQRQAKSSAGWLASVRTWLARFGKPSDRS